MVKGDGGMDPSESIDENFEFLLQEASVLRLFLFDFGLEDEG
jgi:hypothetical protein